MYCPAPVSYTEASFSDLWRLGAASATDSIFKYDLGSTRDEIIATPGDATDGGEAADIAEIAVSPSENYLLFIRKGDRSLWGVRLGVSQ
jgi:hypothetical protein